MPSLTRNWEIFLVHHSHVDIGYTNPQSIVMRNHADYISQSLDYCTATDHLPEGERFTWTCEVSRTVKDFLHRYPNRGEEFFRRVREGRIEVTGLYLQLTDLFGEELLRHSISYASELADRHGFDVITAMQNDVNGWAWGLPSLLVEKGIRYFDIGINQVRSLPIWTRPRPLYWVSPDNSRVLTWHGEVYLQANYIGLQGPGGLERLTDYLSSLETSGYPHNAVQLRIHGEMHDNAPPGLWICDMVHEWNARCSSPKLRLCTSRTWFEHLEKHWPEPITEFKAGWPDWWADGNVSALYESALVREAQANISTAMALEATGGELDRDRLDTARESAMFFCEHTWGAWRSTDDPNNLESKAQWNTKSGFAYTAAIESKSLVQEAMRSSIKDSDEEPGILVFNPLPFPRTDLVEVVVQDEALIPGAGVRQILTPVRLDEGPAFHLVDSETGQAVPVDGSPAIFSSARSPAQRVRFIAHDVPALGWRRYRIVPGSLESQALSKPGEFTIQNHHFKLTVDPQTGGISSLFDKACKVEIVAEGDYTLNQFIYETIDSPEGREALCTWSGPRRDAPFVRVTPQAKVRPGRRGAYGVSIIVDSGGGDVPQLRSEIVLYDDLPRIDIINTITKLPVDCAEAIYHAFPIRSISPTVYLDIPGAIMRPGIDQIPGTATDWHSIQDYFAVSDESHTVTIASPDVPLVQINGINTGKWQEVLPAHNGLVMSWAMNNYWFTNFPATQGSARYRYSISCRPGPFDPDPGGRFAASIRRPLVATETKFGQT